MDNPLTGRLVAAARALTGVSQEELAKASGLAVETVRLMESNGAAWISDHPSQVLGEALRNSGS
jgi:transcriptional regulator with XRE-family HTH domain